MGLMNKHGKKKCLVLYDGYLTLLYKAVQLPDRVMYVCDVCGEEVLPSKMYDILSKGEKVGLTSPY